MRLSGQFIAVLATGVFTARRYFNFRLSGSAAVNSGFGPAFGGSPHVSVLCMGLAWVWPEFRLCSAQASTIYPARGAVFAP